MVFLNLCSKVKQTIIIKTAIPAKARIQFVQGMLDTDESRYSQDVSWRSTGDTW